MQVNVACMGEEKHDGLAVPGRIVLAHEHPFNLGNLRVHPSTRQVERGDRWETLEPRVMQLLVALARAQGRIVTRDELVDWCWDGRIVGDDAINRAISRVRQVAVGIGEASFGVETITKVGYRLVDGTAAPAAVPSHQPIRENRASRRNWLVGAGALAGGLAAGGLLWRRPWRHPPDPEAVELVRLGDLAQRASRPDQTRQSVTYFERAVRIDPKYADAWGMLALSYTHGLEGFSEAQLAGVPARIQSAAARALELDPHQADAQLALACITPYFRNWTRSEAELRKVRDRYPDHWLANGRLAILYYQVGRLIDGAKLHQSVIAREPMIPGPYAFAATALSSAGRVQDADALLKEASDRWPANPLIWWSRYTHLLFSGRPGSALALILDPEARPSGMKDADARPYLVLARAAEQRQAADVEKSVQFALGLAEEDVRAIPDAAQILALFGQLDVMFASLDRYFLDRGTFGKPSPIGPNTRRFTDFLFSAPMAAARSDSRYGELTRLIGLDDYWRTVGMAPPSFPALG